MKNYFKSLFKERYPYPIAYMDGTISRLKSHKEGRVARGFVIGDYMVTMKPIEMDSKEALVYKEFNFEVGLYCCLPPLAVMKKIMKNVDKVNNILKEFDGEPIKSIWYGSANDRYISNLTWEWIEEVIGVHPFILTTSDYIPIKGNIVFYPTAKIYF